MRVQYQRLRSFMDIPLYRNAYALVFNILSTSGLGFLYWLLAARLYDTETVGINSAFIAGMQLIGGLASLNLNNVLIRFAPDAGKNVKKLFVTIYAITISLAFLASVGFLWVQATFMEESAFTGQDTWLLVWFVLSTVAWVVFMIQDAILVALRQAHIVPIENIIFGVAKLGLLVLFVSMIPAFGLYASWTIPVAISLIPINYLIFFRLLPKYKRTLGKSKRDTLRFSMLAKFVSADYAGRLFSVAGVSLLPIIVTNMLGATANAYFTIAWLVTFTLPLMTSGMSQSLTVESALDLDQLGNYTWRILKQVGYLVLPLVTVLLIFAPLILAVFGNDYASEAQMIFRVLAVGAAIHSVNNIALSVARVQKKMWFIFLSEASWSTIVIGLGIFLIPSMGLQGIGVAYVVGQIVTLLLISLPILAQVLLPYWRSAD